LPLFRLYDSLPEI